MSRKPLSMAMILLGVGALILALAQVNQMMISNAQSEISKPLLEQQILASEQQAKALGQSDAEIAATSQQARSIVEQSINRVNQSYQQTMLVDLVMGLILLAGGVFIYPKKE